MAFAEQVASCNIVKQLAAMGFKADENFILYLPFGKTGAEISVFGGFNRKTGRHEFSFIVCDPYRMDNVVRISVPPIVVLSMTVEKIIEIAQLRYIANLAA